MTDPIFSLLTGLLIITIVGFMGTMLLLEHIHNTLREIRDRLPNKPD